MTKTEKDELQEKLNKKIFRFNFLRNFAERVCDLKYN